MLNKREFIEECVCGGTRVIGNQCSLESGYKYDCWQPTVAENSTCLGPGCSNNLIKRRSGAKWCSERCRHLASWAEPTDHQRETKRRSVSRRDARKRGASSQTPYLRQDVWCVSKGNCFWCGFSMVQKWTRGNLLSFTVDHVIPLSKGGSDSLENVVAAHLSCNSSKHDLLVEDLPINWISDRRAVISSILEDSSPTVNLLLT